MRARGLKLNAYLAGTQIDKVAPHAGAWVETHYRKNGQAPRIVAPHAGAWVETACWPHISALLQSRPMRARGLKQFRIEHTLCLKRRAPCGRVG